MTSNVDQWIAVARPDPRPGRRPRRPGPRARSPPKTTCDVQRADLLEWKTAVADAVAKGWSREETVARVNFRDRCPVDVGQGYMMDYIQTLNAGSLWDKLTHVSVAEAR